MLINTNTFTFGDALERQYFIEQVMHAGFRKDRRRSDTYATTYLHSSYPAYAIVLRTQGLTADVYCNSRLLSYHQKNDQSESKLAMQ